MHEKNIQQKLRELSARASAIKSDPKLRHTPTEHDLLVASENARLMQAYQYQTMNAEDNDV